MVDGTELEVVTQTTAVDAAGEAEGTIVKFGTGTLVAGQVYTHASALGSLSMPTPKRPPKGLLGDGLGNVTHYERTFGPWGRVSVPRSRHGGGRPLCVRYGGTGDGHPTLYYGTVRAGGGVLPRGQQGLLLTLSGLHRNWLRLANYPGSPLLTWRRWMLILKAKHRRHQRTSPFRVRRRSCWTPIQEPLRAYSVRQLANTAALAMRTSARTEQTPRHDIGFFDSNGDFLIRQHIASHCGAHNTDYLVVTWYDQSGNRLEVVRGITQGDGRKPAADLQRYSEYGD